MYKIKVDTHTHTLFSGHAYSTVEENCRHASENGMEAIALTDHFGFGAGTGGEWRWEYGAAFNTAVLHNMYGVRVLAGTEIDIADFEGNLAHSSAYRPSMPGQPRQSLCDQLLKSREIVIASLHFFEGSHDGTFSQYTTMYCNAARDPRVDIIGHPERAGLNYDLDEVLRAAKGAGTLIEINEHSFDGGEESRARSKKLILRCAELDVRVVVGSDAHDSFSVGEFSKALAMMEEVHFPEKLIMNSSLELLLSAVKR